MFNLLKKYISSDWSQKQYYKKKQKYLEIIDDDIKNKENLAGREFSKYEKISIINAKIESVNVKVSSNNLPHEAIAFTVVVGVAIPLIVRMYSELKVSEVLVSVILLLIYFFLILLSNNKACGRIVYLEALNTAKVKFENQSQISNFEVELDNKTYNIKIEKM